MISKEKIAFLELVENIMVHCNVGENVARYISCQFALESSFGTSRLAKSQHNFCGMKQPKYRINNSLFKEPEFASYLSLTDCCIDFLFWMLYNHATEDVFHSVNAYCEFIVVKGYCPASDYIDRIDSIYKQYEEYLSNS